jgi:hypothetical protein
MKAYAKQPRGTFITTWTILTRRTKTDIFVIIILYCNNLRRVNTLSSHKRINMDKITEIKEEIYFLNY